MARMALECPVHGRFANTTADPEGIPMFFCVACGERLEIIKPRYGTQVDASFLNQLENTNETETETENGINGDDPDGDGG